MLASNLGAFVYVRTGTTWTQQPTAQDAGYNIVPVPLDQMFGASLAVTPGALVVGDSYGFSGGSAFLFGSSAGGGWQEYRLPGFDAGPGGPLNYGVSMARSGALTALSAPGSALFALLGAVCVYSCSP